MAQPLFPQLTPHALPASTWAGFPAHDIEKHGTGITAVERDVAGTYDIAQTRRAFLILRQTNLYEAQRGLWRESVTRDGEPLDDRHIVDTQLAGLLVESLFDRERAAARYAAVGKAFSRPDGGGEWCRSLSADGEFSAPVTSAREALLVILALAVFDRAAARKALGQLTASRLFDATRAQWNWHWVRDAEFLETDRCADVQLFGCIAQQVLGTPVDVPMTTLAALRKTSLWDTRSGLWNWFMTADQALATSVRPTGTQHLGVIAEALSNRSAARQRLANLTASPLYDPEHRLWNHAVTADGEVLGGERFAMDQLLAIFAHAMVMGRSPWDMGKNTQR